ncbi:MAG: hypothetical protein ACQER7_13480 [Bacteroidota bacterium]
MKKAVLFALIAFISMSVSGQLVKPNSPKPSLDGGSGYITINEFATGYGLGGHTTPYSKGYFGFTSLHGYQANEIFLFGAGTGLLFYNDGLLIPLYLDMRVRLRFAALIPYLSGAGGMLLNPSDFNAGTRMFIHPSGGVMYTINKKLAASVGAGLQIQMGANISRASFVTGKIGVAYKF